MNYVYLLGIGGIGMSALARYFISRGFLVAGYDLTPSPVTEALAREGAQITYHDTIETIPADIKEQPGATTVIYTPAIPAESEQLNWFIKNDYEILKRSATLGKIASDKKTIAIAGTHGKTTTSTMAAHIFKHSGTGCNAFLGGISANYNTNLLLDDNNILVAEADEFDRSFLQLWPDIAVITSADADHLDIYKDHKHLKEAFTAFASQVKKDGVLILREGLEDLVNTDVKCRTMTYSFDNKSDFYASDIELQQDGKFSFTFCHPGGCERGFSVGIPGWINVENSIAAAATAFIHGIPAQKIKEALATFKGVKRRFDIQINTPQCAYIDDYAHHPKEISAAISSIRNIYGHRKLTVIFQPHLYSRTRDFADEFAKSLSNVHRLILLDIYPAREKPIEGVSSKIILDKAEVNDKKIISLENIVEEIRNTDIDTLVTLGAGNIDRIVEPMKQMLEEKYNV
jgi:UDP-N-acetylmuramate--alanine ligase